MGGSDVWYLLGTSGHGIGIGRANLQAEIRPSRRPIIRCGTSKTGRIEITSQNHGYALDPESLPDSVEVDRINLNDGTLEGFRHRRQPFFGVQYHPEASPGPHDSTSLFGEFRSLIEAN